MYNSNSSKTSSCRFTNSRASSASVKPKVTYPRRVLPSKKVDQGTTTDRKACSTGFLIENKKPTKPKKTTKSDFHVRKQTEEIIADYCKKCGDALSKISLTANAESKRSVATSSITKSASKKGLKLKIDSKSASSLHKSATKKKVEEKIIGKIPKSVQQYYKNENYHSTDSVEDITNGAKKISLDTIKEVSEKHTSDSIFKIYPDSDEDITFLDTDDHESLKRLKEFREKNYFECHSAKSRIRNRGSATSLQDHKCVYRFYLNDRLFPVPLSTDHNNQVRCVECHLPMELNVDDSTSINGTIQAKVTIGKKNQDIMLLLPVKEPLIITEKRKEEKPRDKEVLFFGVINLDGFGNSLFNSTLPSNSFALKYQKGYKEYENKEDYMYRDLDKADVIVI